MTKHVGIVDYGMGNLRSVEKALAQVCGDAEIHVSSNPDVIKEVDRVVFPGQGAMPDCMRELKARGLDGAVRHAAAHKPFLGICIGLQMLFDRSEEGDTPGLGIMPGQVRRFPRGMSGAGDGRLLKVPHMGWNEVEQLGVHPVWQGIQDGARFYFVHSYYADGVDGRTRIGQSEYGLRFTCAVARDNIFAVQFHPEKSQMAGLQLLRNFINWQP